MLSKGSRLVITTVSIYFAVFVWSKTGGLFDYFTSQIHILIYLESGVWSVRVYYVVKVSNRNLAHSQIGTNRDEISNIKVF